MRGLIRFLATIACALSGAAIVSYVWDIGWLREWLTPPMAINAAIALFVLGLSVLVLTTRLNGQERKARDGHTDRDW